MLDPASDVMRHIGAMRQNRVSKHATLEERFWPRVEKTDGCWNWKGMCGPYGHGRIKFHYKLLQAHRVAYELLVGPIPDGLVLDHLCRNTFCVNPTHLEPITNGENIKRGVSPSSQNRKKTHCKHGHPLSGDNLVVYPKYTRDRGMQRHCRICRLASEARRRAKKKRNLGLPAMT